MKKISPYVLLSIVFLLMLSCEKKTIKNQLVERGKKAFAEFYKMEADTCIQLDSAHFLFTKMVERPRQGDGDSVYVYLFRVNNNEWSPLLSKGLMRGMSYPPVVSAEVVNLENKEYLYMEYDFGGGSMGNNDTDFILYNLKDTMNEYTLSFEYYPPDVDDASSVEPSNNLKRGSILFTFLYDKLQRNELFLKNGGIAKTEDTPPMSGWKCYGLLGRVKSVKYADGGSLEFNTDGNITKITNVWLIEGGKKHTNIQTYAYQNLTEYTITDSEWGHKIKHKIYYEKNTRTEIEQDGEPFESKFIFDKQGRLSKSYPNVGFDALTIEYKYKSDTDIFPYKEIENAGYEGGGGSDYTISTFDYLKIDTRGNWIERNVSKKVTCNETEWGESVEKEKTKTTVTNITKNQKREIIYF